MADPSRPDADPPHSQETEWLAAARAGSPEACGHLLELCRRYLLQVANAEIDPVLQTKFGPSDMVQETFLEAHRIFARFEGASSRELRFWLRAILLNKVATSRRQYRDSAKRQLGKEVDLNAGGDNQPDFEGLEDTPSIIMMQEERAAVLTAAIDRLPPDYRQVVIWRQLENLSFEEMAGRLERSVDAVRKLWWRAIQQLQGELGSSL